jgi:hypothetical protein
MRLDLQQRQLLPKWKQAEERLCHTPSEQTWSFQPKTASRCLRYESSEVHHVVHCHRVPFCWNLNRCGGRREGGRPQFCHLISCAMPMNVAAVDSVDRHQATLAVANKEGFR